MEPAYDDLGRVMGISNRLLLRLKMRYAKLRQHTDNVRADTSRIAAKGSAALVEAIEDFDEFFQAISGERVNANVRRVLATKFFNHWYSSLILCESGLMTDALLCERSALETLAYYWLVCLDPAAVKEYVSEKTPRPVEVRRRLETLGVDISHIRHAYSYGSEVGHVGRESERFHLDDSRHALLVGGAFSAKDCDHWLNEWLPTLLYLFQSPLTKSGTK